MQTEPESGVHLDVNASGHSRVYQVGQGIQNVNNYIGRAEHSPITSIELHHWLSRAAEDFRRISAARGFDLPPKELASISDGLDRAIVVLGDLTQERTDSVRHLLIGGLVHHLSECGTPPVQPLPEQVILDIAVSALWPLVTAPNVPPSWMDDVVTITSPRIGALVAEARRLTSSSKLVTPQSFARALASQSFARGMANLLDDLSDPKRGGPIVTALAVAAHVAPPPHKASLKAMSGWLFAAAMGTELAIRDDAVQTRIDSIISDLVNTLRGSRRSGGLLDELVEQIFTPHHH